MGYSTQYKGQLTFTQPLTEMEEFALSKLFGEDCRDHPEWGVPKLYYIDLELTADRSGLKWNGAEKTYDLDKLVNVVLKQMRLKFPDFWVTGTIVAQGPEVDDRMALAVGEDGWVHRLEIAPTGRVVTCPHCSMAFSLEGPKA